MNEVYERINLLPPEKKKLLMDRIYFKNSLEAAKQGICPVPRENLPQEFPLSFSQQRLWFLYQWEPESPSYNIPCIFSLKFEVDTGLLEQAVNKLLERHEILRTTYRMIKEEAVQIIHPYEPLCLQIHDLTDHALSEKELRETFIKEKALLPFDLEREFPIRAYLFMLSGQRNYVLLNIHHIACDGWSLDIIINELQSNYEALSNHHQLEAKPLVLQYADFACWQRSSEKSEHFKEHERYWKGMLEGDIPVLELPTDRPRPPVRSFRGATVIKDLPEQLYKDLNKLCVEEDATLYMVTLAAYFILLYRYTGQTDIIIGSPIANRNRTELENIIGFFVNTIPIRIKLNEQATFRETVRQVKKITLEAYEHQDLPLERMIEMLTIERDMSHNALFQVMYVMQNAFLTTFESEQLSMNFEGSVNTNSSKFDLTLSSSKDFLQAEYSTDLFEKQTVEELLSHYINLLESINREPDQVISGMELMTGYEKQQMLADWNRTEAVYEEGFHIVSCIEAWAGSQPRKAALVNEGSTYTYQRMNACANQLAHHLISLGIGPEKIVGIFLERSADFIIAMLAVLKSGGAYVPLDPSYPKDRIQHMIQASGMEVLVTNSRLMQDMELAGVMVLELDSDHPRIASQSEKNPVIRSSSRNLMYIIFTSGSTGEPKGVGIELRNFSNYIQGILEHLKIREAYSYAIVSTLAADLGLTNVFCALCTGGTLHVLSYDRSCDPDAVADYFCNHRIDIMKLVPSHFEVLMTAEHPEYVIPHRTLILAGEGLSWETVRKIRQLRPDCAVENHYGPTETTVSALTYPIPEDLTVKTLGIVPIGRPIGNVRTYVLDSHLNPVPKGVPGELYIGGEGVGRGYRNNRELTESRFIRELFAGDQSSLLYRTGDRVRYLQDGVIEMLGRMDRQVKIRGFRIELGEIEAVITSVSYVKDAVVLVRELDKTDKRIVAYIVFEKSQKMEQPLSELRRKLGEKLPEYMLPSHMIEMDALPLNLNGKVEISRLPSIDVTKASNKASGEKPQTDTEVRIYEVWKEVLATDNIGIDDNFFELGGESFKALKVVRRVSDWIGIMDFFKNPTIRLLAEFLDQGRKSDQQLLHRLRKSSRQGEAFVSLVCVPYAGGSAITYQPLSAQIPEEFDLYAVEIPGHDYSHRESALLSLQETARLCVDEIKSKIKGPIALYGHCVGGALTIEIARQLEAEELPLIRVFVGGALPIARIPGRLFNFLSKLFPSDRSMSNKVYHEFLKALGGFQEVSDEEERDFLIRNLRHDARESEAYFTSVYADKAHTKLKAPITCIVGQKDRATELYEERYLEWGDFSRSVDLAVIPLAGHYFIKYQADLLSGIIRQAIPEKAEESLEAPALEAGSSSREQRKEAEGGKSKRAAIPNLNTFFLVVFSQLVSVLGSGLTSIALGVWVYSQTGSVSDFAAISSSGLIPGILVLPIAGAIVDRYDRRLVMLFSDLAAGLSIAVLAVLMAINSLEVWHIFITSAIGSVSRSFHRPAFSAAVAQIIPKQYLGHANGIVQFSSSTSEMIAPLIGVALYSLIGMKNIFIFDFFSFLAAITILVLIRFPNTLFRKREETFLKEVLMGWKFILKRPCMIYMIAFFFISNILFGSISVLFQPLILSFGSAAQLATISMLGALGGMFAALLMSLWGGTKRRAVGMIGFVILEGFFTVISGLRPDFMLTAIGIFGFWFSVTMINSHWQALIQTKVGLELQGRVLATNQMIAMSSMPIGYFLSGVLADSIFEGAMNKSGIVANLLGPVIGTGTGRGMALLLICAGLLVILWSTIGFRFKPLILMEDSLEDAAPGAVIQDRDTLQKELDRHILSA
jgi:amino acid adenylation domain-containing protein